MQIHLHAGAHWRRRQVAGWLAPRARDAALAQSIGLALASVGAVSAFRWLIDPWAEHRVPYTLFLVGVAVSTRWAGRLCGVLSMLLSLLVGNYFFTEPRFSFSIGNHEELTAVITFLLTSAVVISVLEAETRARRALEERDRMLQYEYTERLRLERELEQSRRLESLGRLAGGVAHDFNNLLTVIVGAAELLKFKLPDDALVKNILLATHRSTELTKQLLGLGRRQMTQIRTMTLDEPVLEALELARPLVPEDIQLETDLTPEPWALDGDVTSLQQILLNLVTNARDALPRGGRIQVRTRNVTLDERFAMEHPELKPGDYVMFSVSDTGPGMSEDLMSHIFEPFFTTKAAGKGTGLGLAVTYGVVKQLQGHILVHSTLGAGSRFEVYLPRSQSEAARCKLAPDHTDSSPIRPLDILLVEDNELVRKVVSDMLAGLGHHSVVASSGEEALTLAREGRPLDLLLTDMVMPGMNGPQVAEGVSALRPDLAVVFMSGYAESVLLEKGFVSGRLLKKPFSTAELQRALKQASSGRPVAT